MNTTDSVMREILEKLVLEIGFQVTRDYEEKNGIWEGMSLSNVRSIDKAVEALSHSLAEARREERTTLEDVVDLVQEMKTDERKVHEFGDYEARTYDEKMLVNAVLDEVISKIMHKLSQIKSDLLTGDNPERKI